MFFLDCRQEEPKSAIYTKKDECSFSLPPRGRGTTIVVEGECVTKDSQSKTKSDFFVHGRLLPSFSYENATSLSEGG
jgi:hypothetical protein